MARPKNLLDLLDDAGKHLLSCSCGAMAWCVLVDRENPKGLELLCSYCHSHSGTLVPERGVDSDIIKQAIAEIDEQSRIEKEMSEDEDWGDEVSRETKPKGKLLN